MFVLLLSLTPRIPHKKIHSPHWTLCAVTDAKCMLKMPYNTVLFFLKGISQNKNCWEEHSRLLLLCYTIRIHHIRQHATHLSRRQNTAD